MFGNYPERRDQQALARQEETEVALFQAGMRSDYRKQQTDWSLTTTAKQFSADLLRGTERSAQGNPFIAQALFEFDFDFMVAQRYALNLRRMR